MLRFAPGAAGIHPAAKLADLPHYPLIQNSYGQAAQMKVLGT